MKTIELFCASQASTAICLNTDRASSSTSSSSTTIQYGGRAIDRHNPIITDPKRTPARDFTLPASPPSPINPKPLHDLKKTKKKKSTITKKSTTATEKSTEHKHIANNFSSKPFDSILRRSWVKPPSDLITPPSSRYLLDDITSLDSVLDYDPVLGSTKVDGNKKKAQVSHEDENNHSSKQHSTPSAPKFSSSTSQVVVLRVSLHCKGCEGKVRKHLSRMQGVTSFNIDFAAKKVTVVGDVTPLSVMANISKVKTAKIWPETASPNGSGADETKKTNSMI
ncbi:protein SODIUM POTASSIUM ROOT DEFECTIVE 2-like [Vicia villosa]|uniref:protein SODIUM POTASSIUM ROOT DEFECTIVE 2-like n=1 Tax=Vicia villosa TaxID=3911 RepID=UPI00273B71BC|nr:protein SODIUM POTASSIUM ROOT DEFECTIVE 2-like [Vicia villosa]